MPRFADYMRLVKFQHTIFAMPFALMAFAYAMWKYALAEVCPVPLWWCVPLVQVVLCMVFARNTAWDSTAGPTGASMPRIPARPVGRFPPA